MAGPGVVLILLIIAATITFYYIIRSKHLENMARIEHGITEPDGGVNQRPILTLGILLCFLGAGVLLAYLTSHFKILPEYISLPMCLLITGGLGLIVSYLVNSKD